MKLLIFIFAMLMSCTACNSNGQKTDKDAVPDTDKAPDTETVDEAVDEKSDVPDEIPDETLDEEPDEICYPLLKDAQFPYYDKEGKITFCRPGCDVPTEKDPQCMSNLWKEQNEALCTQHPEYDCCGYPCVLESLEPMTKEEVENTYKIAVIPMSSCDLKINPYEWGIDGTMGVVKSWNMSEGKIGFQMSGPLVLSMEEWPVKRKYVTYDISDRKYTFVLPARGQEQSYFKGHRIGLISDKRSLELNNRNIFLAYISDTGRKHPVYNKIVHRLAYEPALNDKWAFVNLQETGNPYKMMYAKVGEWEWTVLGEGYGWEPGIVGDTLVLVDDKVNGWICDLSKSPQKLEDCLKVNREGEAVRGIRINQSNEKEFIYNSNIKKLVHLELKGEDLIYRDLISDFTEDTAKYAFSLAALQYRGNILLFEEITSSSGSSFGGLLCYYRLDKNKKYCMKKMERDESYADGTTRFPYGFAEFEGKWILYQKKNSTPLILRDMECYCEKEGVCPFEE